MYVKAGLGVTGTLRTHRLGAGDEPRQNHGPGCIQSPANCQWRKPMQATTGRRWGGAAKLALLRMLTCFVTTAGAEQSELLIAKQYGLGYLQMMVMKAQKIVQKNAAAAGLGEIK